VESPRKLKKKLNDTINQLETSKKRLKLEQQKSRRLKQKVSSLNSVINSLQKEHLISSNCAEILDSTFSGVSKEVFARMLGGKSRSEYPEELQAFAMTLQFYSSRAYDCVRENFDLALPSPRTIRSWYSGVDGDPGFTKQAFDALKARASDNLSKGKETVCSIMFDEMAIKKHIEYSNGRMCGYVDIGTGRFDDSNPVAKDALVFMAVSVNDGWKIPLGYFLIDGLTGEERANLVSKCFRRLHDTGVRAVSLTCDGPSCHFAMMRSLGANMDIVGMDPSFPHPCDPSIRVHIVLDVCHMLKLLRNSFADIGVFKTSAGQTLSWQYIEELNKLQEKEGLRLGNKLRSAHIDWRKQKMKVNLAAQVFSSSVADAIQYCNLNLKLPQFRGSEATVEFLRHIDSAFDVLNSRNPLAQGTKAPMRKENADKMIKILKDAESFLLSLKDVTGKAMYLTPRKTGFVGFVASIKSISKLYAELVASHNAPMTYMLTYKFSQDHIELFFAAVRSRGGFNNNPTASQFMAAYKRLLIRHNVKNGMGNCILRDSTVVLNVTPTAIGSPTAINLARKYDLIVRDHPIESDHDYADIPNFETISEYKEAAVSYIAGFVVRMIKRRLQCMACENALTDKSGKVHKFVALKDRGGLHKASDSVVSVCLETEKSFQRLLKLNEGQLPQGFGVSSALASSVLSNCAGLHLFADLHCHQFDTTVDDNHVHCLIKLASSCYTKIRLFHLGKEKTSSITGPKVRKRMSKLILFNHQ